MEPRYRDAINDASAKLSQALLEDIPTLLEQGLRLDALVRDVLRTVAVALLSALYQGLCGYLVEASHRSGAHRAESSPRALQNVVWRGGGGIPLLAQLPKW